MSFPPKMYFYNMHFKTFHLYISNKAWKSLQNLTTLLPHYFYCLWDEVQDDQNGTVSPVQSRLLPNVFRLISWLHFLPSAKTVILLSTGYCVNSFHAFSQSVFTTASKLLCYFTPPCVDHGIPSPPGIPFLLWLANCTSLHISAEESPLRSRPYFLRKS